VNLSWVVEADSWMFPAGFDFGEQGEVEIAELDFAVE